MRLIVEQNMNSLGIASAIVKTGVFTQEQALYEPIIIPAGPRSDQQLRLVEDHYRQRHEKFAVKQGWEPISPDGMERDAYDRFGRCDYVLLVRTDGRVGAGCRLIWSTPALKLPVQEFLTDPETVPMGSVEVSRMTGSPETARYSNLLLGYLLGYLIEREVAGVYVTIRRRLLEKYEHSGFDCYERLPGKPMQKTNRNGTKELFHPVWIGFAGYQQAINLLSRLCR